MLNPPFWFYVKCLNGAISGSSAVVQVEGVCIRTYVRSIGMVTDLFNGVNRRSQHVQSQQKKFSQKVKKYKSISL